MVMSRMREPYTGEQQRSMLIESFTPFTQYEAEKYRSACGPTTMAAMLEYWRTTKGKTSIRGLDFYESKGDMINHIYDHFGGRGYGMSVRRLAVGLVNYVHKYSDGHARTEVFNNIDTYKKNIDAQRPVAIKFDKYFSLKWFGRYASAYHWVVGIGYEQHGQQFWLKVHDNGAKYKEGGYRLSKIRDIPYDENRAIITMVAVNLSN